MFLCLSTDLPFFKTHTRRYSTRRGRAQQKRAFSRADSHFIMLLNFAFSVQRVCVGCLALRRHPPVLLRKEAKWPWGDDKKKSGDASQLRDALGRLDRVECFLCDGISTPYHVLASDRGLPAGEGNPAGVRLESLQGVGVFRRVIHPGKAIKKGVAGRKQKLPRVLLFGIVIKTCKVEMWLPLRPAVSMQLSNKACITRHANHPIGTGLG